MWWICDASTCWAQPSSPTWIEYKLTAFKPKLKSIEMNKTQFSFSSFFFSQLQQRESQHQSRRVSGWSQGHSSLFQRPSVAFSHSAAVPLFEDSPAVQLRFHRLSSSITEVKEFSEARAEADIFVQLVPWWFLWFYFLVVAFWGEHLHWRSGVRSRLHPPPPILS